MFFLERKLINFSDELLRVLMLAVGSVGNNGCVPLN